MINFSQCLSEKSDLIIQQWITAVAQDGKIQSADPLSRHAIQDHIPLILDALATVLAKTQANDVETLVQMSWQHGALRAQQGFDSEEIAREYHLLRDTIIAHLQTDLLQGTAEEVLRVVSLVNAAVDAALAYCFKSYVSERLKELEQLQQQLTLNNQQLSRLAVASQEQLSVLAHELKTPLNSIIGYSELFLRQQRQATVKDTLPSLEHIERVLRNGRQLLHLITDALELSCYEAGKMQLNLAPTEVRSMIQTVLEVVQPLADIKGLSITAHCDQAPDRVLTDSMRLRQVLTNLLSNAVRYTEVGSIHVNCHLLAGDRWELSVTDTGIGIAPEDQAQIFDPFFRVRSSDSMHLIESTGLGLAIVARLVELLQGNIQISSQVGKGTSFTVTLPLEVRQVETSRLH